MTTSTRVPPSASVIVETIVAFAEPWPRFSWALALIVATCCCSSSETILRVPL